MRQILSSATALSDELGLIIPTAWKPAQRICADHLPSATQVPSPEKFAMPSRRGYLGRPWFLRWPDHIP